MPAGCLKIQLNSGIIFPGLESESIGEVGEELRFHKTTILPPTSDASHKRRLLLPVLLICYKPDVPVTPPTQDANQVQVVPCVGTNQRPRDSLLLRLNLFATPAHRTQEKPFYSLDYQFTTEGIKGYISTAR